MANRGKWFFRIQSRILLANKPKVFGLFAHTYRNMTTSVNWLNTFVWSRRGISVQTNDSVRLCPPHPFSFFVSPAACLPTGDGKVFFQSKNFYNVLHWHAATPSLADHKVLYSVQYKRYGTQSANIAQPQTALMRRSMKTDESERRGPRKPIATDVGWKIQWKKVQLRLQSILQSFFSQQNNVHAQIEEMRLAYFPF